MSTVCTKSTINTSSTQSTRRSSHERKPAPRKRPLAAVVSYYSTSCDDIAKPILTKLNRTVILEEVHELLELGDFLSVRSEGHYILKVVELAQFASFRLLDNEIALKGYYSTRRPVELRNLKHTLTSIPMTASPVCV